MLLDQIGHLGVRADLAVDTRAFPFSEHREQRILGQFAILVVFICGTRAFGRCGLRRRCPGTCNGPAIRRRPVDAFYLAVAAYAASAPAGASGTKKAIVMLLGPRRINGRG